MGKGIYLGLRLGLRRAGLAVAALAVVCARCSGGVGTPTAYCTQYVQAVCNRLYSCATGAALDAIKAQYGPTVNDCINQGDGQLDCAHASCTTGTFSPSNASACLSAYNAEDCGLVTQGVTPTVCQEICMSGDASTTADGSVAPPPAQAGVIATVQPIPNDTTDSCVTPSAFEAIGDPSSSVVPTGSGGVTIACTVVPSGSGYQVSASAESNGAAFSISGLLMPRPRDGSGTPTQDATFVMPNITATFQDSSKSLRQLTCTAQYLDASNGQPGASLPNVADVFADTNGGRVWASVFCNDAVNSNANPQITACSAAATFRFENCASH